MTGLSLSLRYSLQNYEESLNLISLQDGRFFYENGTQFFVRGVYYTGDGKIVPEIDPLADPDVCSRDIPICKLWESILFMLTASLWAKTSRNA